MLEKKTVKNLSRNILGVVLNGKLKNGIMVQYMFFMFCLVLVF